MPQPRRQLIIAVSVTVLDIAAAVWAAPSIWQVWSPNAWLRCALLLVAGIGAFTFMDIWAQTLRYSPNSPISLPVAELVLAPSTQVEMEGMDV